MGEVAAGSLMASSFVIGPLSLAFPVYSEQSLGFSINDQ
jgi:hypothetical protein